MMHMMCSTTILDPYSIDSPDFVVDGCFAAVHKAAEDCTVSWSGFIGIRDVSRLLWFLLFSTTSAFPSWLLLPFGLFSKVLFSNNTLVAFFSSMILESTVPADDTGFLWWEKTRCLTVLSGYISLDSIWIVES